MTALELVVANEFDSTLLVFANDGAGSFTQAGDALAAATAPTFIDPDDDDDDDDDKVMDFDVVSRGAGAFSTFISDGRGGFTRTDFLVGAMPTSIDAVDLDADGDVDTLVVAEIEGSTNRAVRVLRSELDNVGELEFTLIDDLAPQPTMRFALASLLDGDPRPDVIAVSGEDDAGGDGFVDVADLLEILANWGDCPPPPGTCPADLDGTVAVPDLLAVLAGRTG